jgi:hypothetical protein
MSPQLAGTGAVLWSLDQDVSEQEYGQAADSIN